MNFVNEKLARNALARNASRLEASGSHSDASGEKNMSDLLDIESSISNNDFGAEHKNINQLDESKQALLLKMKELSKTMKDYEIKKKNKRNSLLLSNMINVENGEENLVSYNLYEKNDFLENEDGVTGEELKEKISQFLPKTPVNSKEIKTNKDDTLSWYVKVSAWAVFFICLFNFLLLLTDYYITKGNIMASKFSFLYLWKFPFEIFVFLLLGIYVSRKKNQLPRIAGLACAFAGFEAGVIIAIMKLFVYRDMWNMFNLSLEGIFLAVNGAVVGLITSAIFFEIKK